jgi:membrane protease YdiL (CAAX protease family)
MPDPTEPVIIATYCLALGIFALTATVRSVLGKKSEPVAEVMIVPEAGDPLDSPVLISPPNSEERVPTYFYRPLDLLGIGFVFLGFASLVVHSLGVTESGKGAALVAENLVSSIVFQFITAGIVIGFVIARIRPVAWLGLRWRKWPYVFLIAPGAVLFVWGILTGYEDSGVMQWIESLGVETVQDTVKLLQTSTDPQILGLMIFAAVVAAPICEEIVFRGYLYSASKHFTGPWVAGICSALVFSATHGSLAPLLPLFILGCVLAFIYQKTGSLWAPIAVHFCFNGATVALQMAARFHWVELPTP